MYMYCTLHYSTFLETCEANIVTAEFGEFFIKLFLQVKYSNALLSKVMFRIIFVIEYAYTMDTHNQDFSKLSLKL